MIKLTSTQKLAGLLVTLSLGVIFVPMMWEDRGALGHDVNGSNIPPMPESVSTLVFRLNDTGVFRPEEPITQPLDGQAAAPSVPQDNSVPDIDGATLVWMIQIGNFKTEQEAVVWRDKLRAKKFPAFVEAVEGPKTTWRLKVGPEMSVKRAESLRVALEQETGMTGLLVRHR